MKCSVKFLLVMLIFGSATGVADDRNHADAPRLDFSVGEAGIADSLKKPARYGIEYSARPISSWRLIPSIGFVWAENGANYTYLGFQRDFWLGGGWVLTPSFGPGIFRESEELRLGHELEFRSGLEIAYDFPNHYRLGVAFYHVSNGSIADLNPGTESLVLTFSLPLD